ncbi:unannotated protein [freshwater metagenome]|uniref:Unannotated protein n=1 Tax=freshwater metagenome TaxID=449393 RepID=A0A6J7JW63_9ZZZZ
MPEPADVGSAIPSPPEPEIHQIPSTRRGAGRVLVAVYAVFAIAATSRAGVQLVTKFSDARLAYVLSAFAAVVYVVITAALIKGTATARRVATIGIVIELIGVLVVGAFSYVDSAVFPRATVWSHFGEGYGFVPLLLPILGLWFLRRSNAARSSAARSAVR